jgi:hypothetical protein
MRRLSLLVLLASGCLSGVMAAQAPPSAGLWKVTATSQALPPALETGSTASFWNPAAPPTAATSVGLELFQTGDVLGLSGLFLGGTHSLPGGVTVGLLLARVQVRDLVRTTTSPSSEGEPIAVHDQMAGLQVAFERGVVRVGGILRLHDSRFDAIDEGGVTSDFGVRVQPLERVTLAASTHFLPLDLAREPTTDYYLGAEVVVVEAVPIGVGALRLRARYGMTLHDAEGSDHQFGIGAAVSDALYLDAGLTREAAYGGRLWRPAVRLGLNVGRYVVWATRGSGANDLGATYRIALDVALKP